MRLDEAQSLLERISDAYCRALASTQDAVVEAEGLEALQHREVFAAIAARGRKAVESLELDAIPGVERALRQAFQRQSDSIRKLIAKMTDENDAALASLQDTLSSLTRENSGGIAQASLEVVRLRKLAELQDLAAIRNGISETAQRLQGCIDTMQREMDAVQLMLRDEIRTLQRSLEQMRTAEVCMLSRCEFEERVDEAICSGVSFCIIQVSIRNRAQIERLRGLDAARKALSSFTAGVINMLPPGTALGNWDETEFCAMVLLPYNDAIQKARDIGVLIDRGQGPGLTPLKAQFLTVPFDPRDGHDKLRKKLATLTGA